jgi:hypothetical protein
MQSACAPYASQLQIWREWLRRRVTRRYQGTKAATFIVKQLGSKNVDVLQPDTLMNLQIGVAVEKRDGKNRTPYDDGVAVVGKEARMSATLFALRTQIGRKALEWANDSRVWQLHLLPNTHRHALIAQLYRSASVLLGQVFRPSVPDHPHR